MPDSAMPAPVAGADAAASREATVAADANAAAQPSASLGSRMLRGELMAAACPSREVLQHVTSRWGVLVLVALREGVHRFSELRRRIGGVSEKMLAQTLQGLEGDGFVARTDHGEVPPRVDYALTPLGAEVAERVAGLAEWIEANFWRVQQTRSDPALTRAAAARRAQRRPR